MPATILSIVAVVLSATSIGWQVVAFRRSGPVVGVTATQALPTYGPEMGDWHVNVTARNSGRSPVTVTGWGLRFPDGQAMFMTENLSWSTALPYRLEQGASGSWYIPTGDVRKTCAAQGVKHQDMTAFVSRGSPTGRSRSA